MTDSTKTATLYHAPFACSLAVRLAAAWGGVALKVEPVDLGKKTLLNGADYKAINPLGQVSTLRLPNGNLLSETTACLVWVQSQAGDAAFKLNTESETYYQMLRWISFCSTELHKQLLRIVFYDEASDSVKARFRRLAETRLALLDKNLSQSSYLAGETQSAADAYLTWVLTLLPKADVSYDSYAALNDYATRQLDDPDIVALLKDDHCLKTKLMDSIS